MGRLFAFFLIAALAGGIYGTGCLASVSRSIEPNKSISVISLVVQNTGTGEECEFGRFNLTETFPQSLAVDARGMGFSFPPANLASRSATWSFGRLGTGESIKITYSIVGWVNPARLKDFGKVAFSFEMPKARLANGTSAGMPQNQSFSYVPMAGVENAYYVKAGDSIVSLAKKENVSSAVKMLVADKSEAEKILSLHYNAKASENQAKDAANAAHSAAEKFALSREPEESKCKVLIGTDRHVCDSLDSCQYSCYSVTSFCLPIALGSGKYFIGYIWALENSTRALTLALSEEKEAYAALQAEFTPANFNKYQQALGTINKRAGIASSNELINWLCPVPKYDFVGLTNAEAAMADASEKLAPLAGLEKEAFAYASFAAKEIELENSQAKASAQQIPMASDASNSMPNASSPANSSKAGGTYESGPPIPASPFPMPPLQIRLESLVLPILLSAAVLSCIVLLWRNRKK